MARADIARDGKRIKLTTAFMEKDLVKQIPGTRFDYAGSCWYAPLSWGVAWALRGVFGENLEVGEALAEWSTREWEERVRPSLDLRELQTTDTTDDRLYDFQKVAVRFLQVAKRALLADEMGLGKTIETLVALRELSLSGPTLIVCPNSMKYTWLEEIATWWPEARAVILDGNITQRRKTIAALEAGDHNVLITNWEKLRLHSRLAPYGSLALKRCEVCEPTTTGRQVNCEKCEKELNHVEWEAVVVDEAHRMKNPKAKQTRALWWIGRDVPYKYALTGTPIASKPDDLWAIMHFVAPEDWPSRGKFIDRYCMTAWSPWGSLDIVGIHPQRREEFFRVLDPRFLRRTKLVVLPQLPPKVYTTRYVELSPKQKKAYTSIVKTMLVELENGIAAVTNPLTRMLRLLQLTSAYAELDGDKWRLARPSTKIDALLEVIEEAGDQQLAVFAESRQLIQLVEKELTERDITFASIHGEVLPVERKEAIRRLDAGEVKVLVATLGAGGEGITLAAASILVFLERSFSLVKNKQAEDRLHRIGQTAKQVEIVDLIAKDTLDEHRLATVEGKALRLEEIVRDEEALKKFLEGLK